MSTLNMHLMKTGGLGEKIHRFMNQFHAKYGGDHRRILHHKKGIRIVRELFGLGAERIAYEHVKADYPFTPDIPRDENDERYFKPEYAILPERARAAKKEIKALEKKAWIK